MNSVTNLEAIRELLFVLCTERFGVIGRLAKRLIFLYAVRDAGHVKVSSKNMTEVSFTMLVVLR